MTQTNSFDAFTLWKELYNKTESTWRDIIEETLEKESFAQGLGQIQGQYLQYQELVNKMTEGYLKQANIPSREELSNLATLIINVDSKIDTLEDKFDEQFGEQNENNAKEIDQLKKSVTKLDKKLDKVIELLNQSIESVSVPVSVPVSDPVPDPVPVPVPATVTASEESTGAKKPTPALNK